MITHRVIKILLFFLGLCLLFLTSCANFIKPDIGAVARPEARHNLVENGAQNAGLETRDLDLTYSYSIASEGFNLTGELIFDRSLTDSFPVVKQFFLKMSFLDAEGRVLRTFDITPLFSSFSRTPDKLPINVSCDKPAGSRAIAFNYFGVFRGTQENMGGDQWNIYYFPYD